MVGMVKLELDDGSEMFVGGWMKMEGMEEIPVSTRPLTPAFVSSKAFTSAALDAIFGRLEGIERCSKSYELFLQKSKRMVCVKGVFVLTSLGRKSSPHN